MEILEQFELDKIELQLKIISEINIYKIDLNCVNMIDFLKIQEVEDYIMQKEKKHKKNIEDFINTQLNKYRQLPLIKIHSEDTHIVNSFWFTLLGISRKKKFELNEINLEFRKKTKLYL